LLTLNEVDSILPSETKQIWDRGRVRGRGEAGAQEGRKSGRDARSKRKKEMDRKRK